MSFTELDPLKERLRYANAGMPSPLLFRHGEASARLMLAVGVYIGQGL